MQAIVSKSFIFTEEGHPSFRVRPSPKPQGLPSWVSQTRLFELASKDGSIVETKHAAVLERKVEDDNSQRNQKKK